MTQMTARKAFWRGYLDCAPFILIVIPYSMLFGVVARDAGLDLFQTMSMTILVIAGAAHGRCAALRRPNTSPSAGSPPMRSAGR